MNIRHVYLYVKGNDTDDIISLLKVFEEFHITKLSDHFVQITTDADIDMDILANAREFSIVELYQDFTVFVAPYEFDFDIREIQAVMPDINPKIYHIESLIPELVLLGKWSLLKKLKNYYYSKFNSETIETVLGFIDQNMNASKTAKALYMHRNTLNYRLDNFIHKTEIDVRAFSGALAIYMLFRR